MIMLEDQIFDALDNVDDTVEYYRTETIAALLESYTKALDILIQNPDSVVLEQYDLFMEAEAKANTTEEKKKNIIQKIFDFIVSLMEGMCNGIRRLFNITKEEKKEIKQQEDAHDQYKKAMKNDKQFSKFIGKMFGGFPKSDKEKIQKKVENSKLGKNLDDFLTKERIQWLEKMFADAGIEVRTATIKKFVTDTWENLEYMDYSIDGKDAILYYNIGSVVGTFRAFNTKLDQFNNACKSKKLLNPDDWKMPSTAYLPKFDASMTPIQMDIQTLDNQIKAIADEIKKSEVKMRAVLDTIKKAKKDSTYTDAMIRTISNSLTNIKKYNSDLQSVYKSIKTSRNNLIHTYGKGIRSLMRQIGIEGANGEMEYGAVRLFKDAFGFLKGTPGALDYDDD